ncbi:hypothetical protein Nepgr_032688 [Nepenthes gracilis]|uniref:Uncharacterized protein n=1 Tax=Nepenthes gracilis TaxID=150966 RepID=A0AAD3TJ40_NEPGR|nr:hypothetical protein Nepgr_032688 [Nepenthes gracilis]
MAGIPRPPLGSARLLTHCSPIVDSAHPMSPSGFGLPTSSSSPSSPLVSCSSNPFVHPQGTVPASEVLLKLLSQSPLSDGCLPPLPALQTVQVSSPMDLIEGRRPFSVHPAASMTTATISPSGVIVDALSATRWMGGSSLLDVVFVVQNQNAASTMGKVTSLFPAPGSSIQNDFVEHQVQCGANASVVKEAAAFPST